MNIIFEGIIIMSYEVLNIFKIKTHKNDIKMFKKGNIHE